MHKWLTHIYYCSDSVGVLQARKDRRLCQVAGGGTYRWKPRLQRPWERPDDVSGHSRGLLCPTGSEREEQRCQEGPYQPVHSFVHHGRQDHHVWSGNGEGSVIPQKYLHILTMTDHVTAVYAVKHSDVNWTEIMFLIFFRTICWEELAFVCWKVIKWTRQTLSFNSFLTSQQTTFLHFWVKIYHRTLYWWIIFYLGIISHFYVPQQVRRVFPSTKRITGELWHTTRKLFALILAVQVST